MVTAALKDIDPERSTVNSLNEQITQAVTKAKNQYCCTTIKRYRKISDRTKGHMNLRRELRSAGETNNEQVRTLNKEISKEIRKDLRKYNTQQIKKTVEDNGSMKVLRRNLANGKSEIYKLRNTKGETSWNRDELITIAEEFYSNLYKRGQNKTEKRSIPRHDVRVLNQGSEEILDISIDEIRNALSGMKNNKCPGEDEIPIEAIKLGGEALWGKIRSLLNMCLQNGVVPNTWNNAILILLHKKGDATRLENYRPISLLSHLYKLLTKIITTRLTSKLNFCQPKEQAGFRAGYGTNDHLQAIKTLVEKCIEYNKPLVLTFIDFQKAFDTVEMWAIVEALQQSRIDYRYAALLKHIYENATASIKLHKQTNKFRLERGIRQGDTISPKLFTAVLEYVFKMLPWEHRGVTVDGETLNHLRFADDIVLITDNIGDARIMVKQLKDAAEKVGLGMNMRKTKVMTNLVLSEMTEIDVAKLEQVDSYTYLGHEIRICRDNQTGEIHRRIGLGWAAFGKLRNTFKSDLPMCLKRKGFEQCVLPVVT